MGEENDLNVFSGPDRRIQFWSDAGGKEFAVRLSNEPNFRAVSNPAVDYTKLVEEAEYFSDMDYDWKFLLEHWIGVKNGSIRLFDLNGKEETRPAWSLDSTDTHNASIEADEKRVGCEKPKPLLKCHYCMLSYNSEKERQEHELAWHFEKMQKDSNQANAKEN